MLLLAILPRQASAYTDPGSGALIWQTFLASIVGFLFYFRALTRWLLNKKGKKQ